MAFCPICNSASEDIVPKGTQNPPLAEYLKQGIKVRIGILYQPLPIFNAVLQNQIAYRGGLLHFTDAGKGRVLVLIHGYLGSAEIWSEFIPLLAKRYRVIAIDLPGHGKSSCFGYVHGMELMAKAVKAVLDHLKLRRYVLAGHSLGGYVALAFAELYPDNLRGLSLFNSTAYPDSQEKKADRNRAANLVIRDRKVYTEGTIKNLFAEKNLRYLKRELRFATNIALRTSRQGMVAALIGMRDRPGRDILLGLVHYPILMVIGAHDNILPEKQLFEQASQIKHGATLYLEHDGHFSFLESPKTCATTLRKFLRVCYAPSG